MVFLFVGLLCLFSTFETKVLAESSDIKTTYMQSDMNKIVDYYENNGYYFISEGGTYEKVDNGYCITFAKKQKVILDQITLVEDGCFQNDVTGDFTISIDKTEANSVISEFTDSYSGGVCVESELLDFEFEANVNWSFTRTSTQSNSICGSCSYTIPEETVISNASYKLVYETEAIEYLRVYFYTKEYKYSYVETVKKGCDTKTVEKTRYEYYWRADLDNSFKETYHEVTYGRYNLIIK